MCRKICEQCGREFEVSPCRKDSQRFCSRKCYNKWRIGNTRGENCSAWKGGNVVKICEHCGGEFEIKRSMSKQRFCSVECKGKWQSEYMRGENAANWGGGNIVKRCKQCGGEFEIEPNKQNRSKFCSKECYSKWQIENTSTKPPTQPKRRVELVCKQCSEEFEVIPSAIAQQFCSRKCKGKWQSENIRAEKNPVWKGGKIATICKQCGEIFKVHPSFGQQFCSVKCKNEWFSGENAHTWNGGISFEPYCHKFNEKFKESIREKFGRVCFLCPTTEEENGQKLSVHHTNYNKDCLCDDSDCEFVPLCVRCHSKTNANRDYWEKTIMDKLINPIN